MDSSVALGRLELACPLVSRGSCLPEGAHLNGCVPLSHQVAGHKYGVDKVGILQHPDGTVLKQLQPPPRGPREMQFYSMVYAEDCCDSCLVELRAHLPKYYGMWSSPDAPADLYLKLEDVTKRFQKPCIMDVKIGQKSYDPFASQEKREQQIRKYPLMEEIGFLVLGMRVYKPSSDSFDTYDQHYGRGLVKDTIKEGFTKFFYNDDSLRKDAITASILKVRRILHWFEGQSRLNFYASSLLFVYEGACGAVSVQNSQSPPDSREQNNNIHLNLCSMFSSLHKKSCVRALHQATNGNRHRQRDAAGEAGEEASGDVEVKMIDFAHVFPSDVHDQGFIYGLKNLLKVLQQVLDQ